MAAWSTVGAIVLISILANQLLGNAPFQWLEDGVANRANSALTKTVHRHSIGGFASYTRTVTGTAIKLTLEDTTLDGR